MSPRQPEEGASQRELLLRLRYQIDTAMRWPTIDTINAAILFAREHPVALRSSHFRTNLGQRRWDWLAGYGLFPLGEASEIAGSAAIKATISPEIVK